VTYEKSTGKGLPDLDEPWKGIDILITMRGLALGTDKIQEGNPKNGK
jgi:NADP-dependent 3-hydroxy acid dehydrogenase YdfG